MTSTELETRLTIDTILSGILQITQQILQNCPKESQSVPSIITTNDIIIWILVFDSTTHGFWLCTSMHPTWAFDSTTHRFWLCASTHPTWAAHVNYIIQCLYNSSHLGFCDIFHSLLLLGLASSQKPPRS